MSGATLTMASATKPTLQLRSFSSPDLLSLSSNRSPSPASSKDLPALPAFQVPPLDDTVFLDLKTRSDVTVSTIAQNQWPSTDELSGPRTVRASSDVGRSHSWIDSRTDDGTVWPGPALEPTAPSGHHSLDLQRVSSSSPSKPVAPNRAHPPPQERPRTASGSYIDFARRSWLPGSRAPSLDGESAELAASAAAADPSTPVRRIWGRQKPVTSRSSDSISTTSRALNRATIYLAKMTQKQQTVFGRAAIGAPPLESRSHSSPSPSPAAAAAAAAGAQSAYEPGRALQGGDHPGAAGASSTDVSTAEEPLASAAAASPQPAPVAPPNFSLKDPLWSPFRDLEGAYQIFISKSTTAHRMAVVKAKLVPFLHRYARDPSNKDTSVLTAEALERRTAIMGKWWAALLQLLDGNSGRVAWSNTIAAAMPQRTTPQALAGLDRPISLGAITMLMIRPEWRLGTPHFRPLTERSPSEKVRARSDSGARFWKSASPAGQCPGRGVEEIFLASLLAQVAVVVEKLSLRNAPPSMVTFAGKTLAYAFFFVPGLAQILVRLWGLDSRLGVVRRVVDEIGLPRTSQGESDDIVALFPPSLGSLGYSSVKTLGEKLRQAPKIPDQAAYIPWHGAWLSRWRGGDTNLLFVFCKYFYVISEEFMPAGLPLVEKARAPAFVLIQAQLLSILDDTINRQAAVEALMRPQFLDSTYGADASLSHMSPLLPHTNMFRGMDENCLIVLLRDFLLADDDLLGARTSFAEAFMCLLKAATKRTGRYDHNSQHLLCDFLHEALDAYSGADSNPPVTDEERPKPSTPSASMLGCVDWPFWLDVCKMMLSNDNTMTEIRVLSLLFSTWDVIAADPARKEVLCLKWLLTEEVFAKFFCNWCPMVRAYYMRLLCWRICRDSGSPNESDAKIWACASDRLRETWAHYLWLKRRAEQKGLVPPSTTPSLPQPGKRFMIVRTEVMGATQQGIMASPGSRSNALAQPELRGGDGRSPRSLGPETGQVVGSTDDGKPASPSKRWSILGKLRGSNQPGGETERRSYEDELDRARRDMATARRSFDGPPLPPKNGVSMTAAPSSDSDSTGSAPMFDQAQYIFRFALHNVPWHQGAPVQLRERVITRPRLPAPAQARVSAKLAMVGGDSPPPSAGLPPPTRVYSGQAQGGLVSEARNAQPLSPDPTAEFPAGGSGSGLLSPNGDWQGRRSFGGEASPREFVPIGALPFESASDVSTTPVEAPPTVAAAATTATFQEQLVLPTKPTGVHSATATYAGRALAEWGLVVSECNTFVDRRRDEGVLGLSEVEVPSLGIEGLRR